jgi:hypothetical protein
MRPARRVRVGAGWITGSACASIPLPGPPPSPSPSPSAAASAPASASGGQAVVDVLNGSGRRGAAADESSALAALGYGRGWVGNAASRWRTKVTYGAGAEAAATAIARRYGVTASPAGAVPAGHVQVVLGTGGGTAAGSARAAAPDEAGSSPATASQFYGTPVTMGGIPCVD